MKQETRKKSAQGRSREKVKSQVAALCWRMRDDRAEVLLVTSRDTGRWVIPKGWPIKGKSDPHAALQEAWEEAGVKGEVCADCVGFYTYDKRLKDGSTRPVVVSVFPVEVRKLADDFPERRQRRRDWVSSKEAARRVDEPELKALLAGFHPPSGRTGQPDRA